MVKRQLKTDLDAFREKCRAHNLSITPQRIAVYTELVKSKEHPCAEDIFERIKKTFPDISLDTVYRTLSTFAEIGIIDVVEGYGEAKRYDPDMTAHHHFRCRKCNKIIDFHNKDYDNIRAPKEFGKGYEITGIKVVVEGLCNKCA
ncbi:MAG: transcriptional repressor [Phycisphaerae bacterium]|jgi:Fur family peroxide stress response transcriptional regulator